MELSTSNTSRKRSCQSPLQRDWHQSYLCKLLQERGIHSAAEAKRFSALSLMTSMTRS